MSIRPLKLASSSSRGHSSPSDATELIPLEPLPPATDIDIEMSSPRASRAWDIGAGPSNYRHPSSSRSRRSSSSIRRPRNESFSSLLPYDPDTYTDDLIPQDVIFDGPSSSSVPTSVSQFAHRGSRASFAADEDRVRFFAADFDSDAEEVLTEIDPEEEDRHSMISSRISEASSVAVLSTPDVERGGDQFPLIRRKSSEHRSDTGSISGRGRSTQKIYLADEDMVVVMSGFRTRRGRLWIYRLLCLLTLGMMYLIMRWLPRWRLKFLAEPVPLSEAHWVVIEVFPFPSKLIQNQYSELSTHRIRSTLYGLPLSSCFAPSTAEEAEDDPVLEEIRYLDYRYIRFVFHPIRGKFQLMSNWRDPSWRNLKDVVDGLEGDTRDARAGLFGENVIDIEEKPILTLLIDEVNPLNFFD